MNSLLITLLLLAGASLQTLLPGPAALGSIEWPVLTSLILCIALRTSRWRALYAGVLAGLLHDSFCPAPLGVSIPFYMLIALGGSAIREEVFGDQMITYAVLGLLAGLLQTLYFTTVFVAFGLRPIAVNFAIRLLGGVLLGAATAPLLFLLFLVHRPGRSRRMRWIDA